MQQGIPLGRAATAKNLKQFRFLIYLVDECVFLFTFHDDWILYDLTGIR
jgi:hypothetical protein